MGLGDLYIEKKTHSSLNEDLCQYHFVKKYFCWFWFFFGWVGCFFGVFLLLFFLNKQTVKYHDMSVK